MNTPAEIAEQYVKIGAGKAAQPLSKTLVLAILAGLFIGFGAAGSTVAAATVPQGSVAKLVSACIFPVSYTHLFLAHGEVLQYEEILHLAPPVSLTLWTPRL